MGMANFNKNLFVGVGGVEGKSTVTYSNILAFISFSIVLSSIHLILLFM